MGGKLDLVPAAAGRRLGAAVLDWVGPAALLVVMLTIGFTTVTRTQSGGFIIYDTGMLVLLGSIAAWHHGGLHCWCSSESKAAPATPSATGSWASAARTRTGTPRAAEPCSCGASSPGQAFSWPWSPAVLVVVFKWFGAALWILAPLVPARHRLGVRGGALQLLGQERQAQRLARHRGQDPRVRRQRRPQPRHNRRNPGPVQFRAAGPPARATGFLTDCGCGRQAGPRNAGRKHPRKHQRVPRSSTPRARRCRAATLLWPFRRHP